MTSRRRVIAGVAAAGLVPLLAPCASRAQQPYTEISYQSGGLRIQGYFYQPAGPGPFPTLIYNHGSRAGFERRSIPWVQLAGLYAPPAMPCWCRSGAATAGPTGRPGARPLAAMSAPH